MNSGGQIKKIIYSLSIVCFLFTNISLLAQKYENNLSGNYSNLYGGRPLKNSQITIGGRKLSDFQPKYGGQKMDEQAVYNPQLNETFNYIGKPLFSPNPYSYPRLIDAHIYNQETKTQYPSFAPYQDTHYPVSKKHNASVSQNKQEGKVSISPIIPVVIGAIDAMYRGNKGAKERLARTKRLSFDGWSGSIQTISGQSGNFDFRNTNGGTISGSYSVIGSQ
ncbi:MAG: hypothetical protein ACP5QY_06335, partial [Candidatus Hydrogenedens sp.]